MTKFHAALPRYFRRAVIALFVVSLCSCLDLTSTYTFHSDGSGTLGMHLVISKEIANAGSLPSQDFGQLIPDNDAAIKSSLKRVPGIGLVSYSNVEKGGDRVVDLVLSFDSIAHLSKFLSFSKDIETKISVDKGTTVFSETLWPGFGKAYPSDITKQILDGLKLTTIVITPKSCTAGGSVATKTSDTSVQCSIDGNAIANTQGPLTFTVRW